MTPEEEVAMLREENVSLRAAVKKLLKDRGVDVDEYFRAGKVDESVAQLLTEAP